MEVDSLKPLPASVIRRLAFGGHRRFFRPRFPRLVVTNSVGIGVYWIAASNSKVLICSGTLQTRVANLKIEN